jgi:hypothetical protein
LFRNWKPLVYEYVRKRNEHTSENSVEPLLHLVVDGRVMDQTKDCSLRRSQSMQDRSVNPLQHETRLKIKHVYEQRGIITAHIEMRHSLHYKVKDHSYLEERIEHEKLELVQQQGQWLIHYIHREVPERSDIYVAILPYQTDEPPSRESTPLINQHVYTSRITNKRGIMYDRNRARDYAERWWNDNNPNYIAFDVDCTSYVSQCLFAGGAPMNYTGKRVSGWWYQGRINQQEAWSFSWSVSNALQLLLSNSKFGLRAEVVQQAHQLTIGDVICYDWDGNNRYQHSTIVTSIDPSGMPLVNAHTANSRARYWDYKDSYAWSNQTRYRFFHIADQF